MCGFRVLLFDLDGTLLPMDTGQFLQAYLTTLAPHFAPFMPPEQFVQELLRATREMVENTEGSKTNAEVFWESFLGKTSFDPEQTFPVFEQFYLSAFPKLHVHTQPTPLAREVLTKAAARGCELVLATNPVFPRIAIEERLRWAGIADVPFRLITDYETMHYCKPNLSYFQEILEKVEVDTADCLMIGNDPAEDMVAAELGISTYLVEDCAVVRDEHTAANINHRGMLEELVSFLDSRSFNNGHHK